MKNKDAPIQFEQLFFFFFFSLRGFGCFWKLRSNDYDNTSCTWKIIMWKFFDMLQSVFIVLITQVVCVRQTTLLKARSFVPFIPNSMHLHSNLCKDNSKVGVFETLLLSCNLSRSITKKINENIKKIAFSRHLINFSSSHLWRNGNKRNKISGKFYFYWMKILN